MGTRHRLDAKASSPTFVSSTGACGFSRCSAGLLSPVKQFETVARLQGTALLSLLIPSFYASCKLFPLPSPIRRSNWEPSRGWFLSLKTPAALCAQKSLPVLSSHRTTLTRSWVSSM
eukprot:scaffold412_cov311-Pavlova_lutheri.AAC.4